MSIRGQNVGCLAVLLLCAGISQAREPKQNEKADVIVEMKFVHLDQNAVEKLKQQGLFKESKGENVLSLDKAQMSRFMQVAQSDIHGKLLEIAQLAMRNGETAVRSCGEEQHFVTGLEIVSHNGQIEYLPKKETIPLGPQIKIRSHVSTDWHRVRVHIDAKINNLDSPKVPRFRITTPDPNNESGTATHFIERPKISTYGVKRMLVVPNGNTAVLTGGTFQCVQATVSKVPILGDVPCLGTLFRTVTYEVRQQYLLVLVTPRIVVPQEKEDKARKAAARNAEKDVERQADYRTPIIHPVREGDAVPRDTPDEARILRALPPLEGRPGIYDVSRDNIQIVTEKLPDCRWKCTVYYIESITGHWPFAFHWTQPRTQVVYVTLPTDRTPSPERRRE